MKKLVILWLLFSTPYTTYGMDNQDIHQRVAVAPLLAMDTSDMSHEDEEEAHHLRILREIRRALDCELNKLEELKKINLQKKQIINQKEKENFQLRKQIKQLREQIEQQNKPQPRRTQSIPLNCSARIT